LPNFVSIGQMVAEIWRSIDVFMSTVRHLEFFCMRVGSAAKSILDGF